MSIFGLVFRRSLFLLGVLHFRQRLLAIQSWHKDVVLKRWWAVSKTSPLTVLCRDLLALRNCKTSQKFNDRPMVQCIDAPQRLGVETMVAKYLAMASTARSGVRAVWLDLDVYVVSDPTFLVEAELAKQPSASLFFSRHILSESVTPAVVIARPNPEAVSLLMGFASWLRENPYLLDHKAWDQFLTNNKGDFAGLFDYKGRNTTGPEVEGPTHTFLPPVGLAPAKSNWTFISSGFASGDGWLGLEKDLVLFHFWGTAESPEELFHAFYNETKEAKKVNAQALGSKATQVLQSYWREPVSAPLVSVLLKKEPLYLAAISYAHGCCRKSLKRNRDQALKHGVDQARSYGKQHLGPDWLSANDKVLSQKRGAGWWLWKPYVILKTLKDNPILDPMSHLGQSSSCSGGCSVVAFRQCLEKQPGQDPAIPWERGVVLWIDAGNYLHHGCVQSSSLVVMLRGGVM